MRRIVLDTNCLLQSLPSRSPYHKIWTEVLAGNNNYNTPTLTEENFRRDIRNRMPRRFRFVSKALDFWSHSLQDLRKAPEHPRSARKRRKRRAATGWTQEDDEKTRSW